MSLKIKALGVLIPILSFYVQKYTELFQVFKYCNLPIEARLLAIGQDCTDDRYTW